MTQGPPIHSKRPTLFSIVALISHPIPHPHYPSVHSLHTTMSASSSTIFNRAVGLAPRAPLYRCSKPLATGIVRPASATMARSIHSSAPRANATPAVSNEQVKNLEFEKLKKTYVMDHHLYKPTGESRAWLIANGRARLLT